MRSRTIMISAIVLTCAASIMSCTKTSAGQAESGPVSAPEATTRASSTSSVPTSASASNGDLPSDGAPKVSSPLDASRFQHNPCGTLTTAQLQTLNVPSQGVQRDAALGPQCEWRNKDTNGTATIHFSNDNPRGLSAVYRANKQGSYKYFNVLPNIEGYPAVAFDVVDGREHGECAISVGLTDALIIDVSVQLSLANTGKKDPCEVTAQVAGMAVQTMKAGG